MRVSTHLHLPRLKRWAKGGDPAVISVKEAGRPVRYVSALALTDVEFKVSQAGRERTLREHVRNVHAWVCGDVAPGDIVVPVGARRARYNPFQCSSFVDAESGQAVLRAECAWMLGSDVYYLPTPG